MDNNKLSEEDAKAYLTKYRGNYTRIGEALGLSSMAVGAQVRALGLKDFAKECAVADGWSHTGRPPQPLPPDLTVETVVETIKEIGITAAAKKFGVRAERLHRMCDQANQSMRGRRVKK